jgi:hypothetical protein
MWMRTLWAHLLGFAVLMAALLLLPHAAKAHPGHAHAMHVHHTAPASPAVAGDQIAHDTIEQSLNTAAQTAPGHLPILPCERGCCAQSSCAACFSAVAPMPPQVAPPLLRTVIGFAADPLGSGIDGPSLRRPPRSFA